MEIDWSRRPTNTVEARLANDCLRRIQEFFQDLSDPAITAKISARSKLTSITNPIALNALDAIASDATVAVSQRAVPPDFLSRHSIEWSDIEWLIHALASVDAIKFARAMDGNHYDIRPASLIRQHRVTSEAPESPGETTSQQDAAAWQPAHEILSLIETRTDLTEEERKKAKGAALNHSRPLDVHRWSDHPAVNSFITEIYDTHFKKGNEDIQKKHIKVLLLDLYVAWCEDPSMVIAVSFTKNNYKARSRYNGLHISHMTIEIAKKLISVKLIEHEIGFQNPQDGSGRLTRVWPTAALIEQFQSARFGPLDIDSNVNEQCIILRDTKTRTRRNSRTGQSVTSETRVRLEYRELPETNRMRAQLTAHNELLKHTFIDIPTLDEQFIDLGNSSHTIGRLYVNQGKKFVRRIFNRGSWNHGGRFWGGWWQRCPKEWRAKIFLNDWPITEIDYSGMHIIMLYANEGIDYWSSVSNLPKQQQDPYTINLPDLALPDETLRAICKQLILVALNAKDESATFSAFRDCADPGSPEEHMTNAQLIPILAKLREKHQPIAHKFASDAGIELMRMDSDITAHIIEYFTRINLPILTIHDSYLVPMGYEQHLEKQMRVAFKAVTGVDNVKLKHETQNPDSRPGWEDAVTSNAIRKQRFDPPRSERYQFQLSKFKERLSGSGIEWIEPMDRYGVDYFGWTSDETENHTHSIS